MRAGPLSDDKVIECLNDGFVNTWIIIPQFEKPAEFFQNESARELAKVVANEFTYPVDSIVISAKGKPLAQGEFSQFYRSNAAAKYLEMLEGETKRP